MAGRGTYPVKVGDVLSAILAGRGLGGGGASGKLSAKWEEAVGAAIAAHAAPESIKGGKLTLVVDSPVWMNQLSLLAPTLITQINAAIGEEAVTDVRFRMGNVARPGKPGKKEGPYTPKRRPVTQSEREAVERSLSPIKDEEIKEVARSLFLKSCARKRETK